MIKKLVGLHTVTADQLVKADTLCTPLSNKTLGEFAITATSTQEILAL
ncbi:hypothetical protein UMZ34_01110 [Halopseudomonas pachastrellae]|nr:hypothetical protein UMZ34_01110 [Halopseudomonas pachastrellae]